MRPALEALLALGRAHPTMAGLGLGLLASLALLLVLSMLESRRLRGTIRKMEKHQSKLEAHFWTARTIMAPCERCWGAYTRAQGGRDNARAWGVVP